MFLLRTSLVTAKALGRSLGVWPLLLLLAWTAVIKIQEPDVFVRQGVPFFWPSQAAMLTLMVGLLPLGWRLSQGSEAALWSLRTSREIWLGLVSTWLGIVLYGLLLIAASIVFALCAHAASILSLYRITLPSLWSGLLGALASSLVVLLVTSSFAPALALLPWSTAGLVFAWMPLQAAILALFGAVEFSGPPGAGPVFSGIVSTLLAVLGGLSVSLAHTYHRLRH